MIAQLSSVLLLLLVTIVPSKGFVSRAITLPGSTSKSPLVSNQRTFSLPVLGATDSKTSDLDTTIPIVTSEESDKRLSLLDDALVSFNASAATEILDELSAMRRSSSNNTNQQQSTIDTVLNDLLSRGPDSKLPFWSRLRPLTRFSKRARLASLSRTLDLTTPPPNEDDNDDDDSVDTRLEDRQRRRRRALLSLLRSLSSSAPEEKGDDDNQSIVKRPAIVFLEKKARREQKLSSINKNLDLTARRPQDLETPNYKVLVKRPSDGYEIRRYEPFSVCSVSMNRPRPKDASKTDATVSDPNRRSARAFGALAGYLFGKNQKEEAMKMTTPVLTNEQGDDKVMSFVLPSDFWSNDGLALAPQPLQGSGVALEQNQGGERAVVMFGGYASKKSTEQRKAQLLNGLAKDKEWAVVDENEPVSLAQYNDPFTPPWKRLNEVSVAVRPVQS